MKKILIIAMLFLSCKKNIEQLQLSESLIIKHEIPNTPTYNFTEVCITDCDYGAGGKFEKNCLTCPGWEEENAKENLNASITPCKTVCTYYVEEGGVPGSRPDPPQGVGGGSGGNGTTKYNWEDKNDDGYDDQTSERVFKITSVIKDLDKNSIEWLLNNPESTTEIYSLFEQGNKTIGSLPSIKATILAFSTGKENAFDISHYNLVVPSYSIIIINPIVWAINFRLECALLKEEHPEWSKTRIYYEATRELIQIAFDGAGLIPVIGEIFDIANGVIYTISGDGVNATLSYVSAIPVVGWYSAGAKIAKRLYVAGSVSTTLKWIRGTDGLITFGRRSQLRTVLELGNILSDSRIAHHIIPVQFSNHILIQRAARASKNTFHMNEFLNGIPVQLIYHKGSHNNYNMKVLDMLDKEFRDVMTPEQAREKLMLIIDRLRTAIKNNPQAHINTLP